MDRRFTRQFQEFLHEWATVSAPANWEKITSEKSDSGPWLSSEDLGAFTRYIRDYLSSKDVFGQINSQLLKVVGLNLRDEAAKRRARRKYVRIILNDLVMNPGPGDELLEDVDREDENDFGLMGKFVTRWRSRLPTVLAAGAGAEIHIPPGNPELIDLLLTYQ